MTKKRLNLDTQLKDIEVEGSDVLSEEDKKILEEDQEIINKIISDVDKISVDELDKKLEKYVNFGLEDLDNGYLEFVDETDDITSIVNEALED